MRLVRLAPIAVVALVVAACSGSGQSPAPSTAASPSAPVVSNAPSAAATRIEVTVTDALKIEPASMTVPAGQPVTFVVTNTGTIEHEFVLGDEAEQAAHEQEMAASMGMTHDEAMAIGVKPGTTKELTVTFDAAGPVLVGCHFPGHYAGGMRASVMVTE
jgi:uncharacterized cupredoxin-like copper-binding protein